MQRAIASASRTNEKDIKTLNSNSYAKLALKYYKARQLTRAYECWAMAKLILQVKSST